MTEFLTITNEPPEHPGMDFALLRKEGIEMIRKLAGKSWTDYNAHDPGITLLEILCYAMTDLSYRLDFPINDLLAPKTIDSHPISNNVAVEPDTINQGGARPLQQMIDDEEKCSCRERSMFLL